MPRIAKTLTVAQVAALAKSGKNGTFAISPRLYLQVGTEGASLLYRYISPFSGKPRSMGLGKWEPKTAKDALENARAQVARFRRDAF
jgi:hypothetical protein